MSKLCQVSKHIIEFQAFIAKRKIQYDPIFGMEDFVQEGWLIYEKCKKLWDENKGAKFSTYLTVALIRRFREMVCKRAREVNELGIVPLGNNDIPIDTETPEKREEFHSDALSDMAERFLSLSFSPSPELCKFMEGIRGSVGEKIGRFMRMNTYELRLVKEELFAEIARG